MSTCLLIIDPQCDFCDGPAAGSLAVPGAWDDMERLARHIVTHGDQYDAITVTLDSHGAYDIGHPSFWRDEAGAPPPPFTLITREAVASGQWGPADPAARPWVLTYLERLEQAGRYTHIVWPEHCLIGTPGHQVHPAVSQALLDWQRHYQRSVTWLIKGLNPRVENYSAFGCEVADPEDAHASENGREAILALASHEAIHVAGEALSHCVKSTVEDLLAGLRAAGIVEPERRLTMLTTMMSPVPALPGGPDFPAIGQAFLNTLNARGAALA
ncbi:cysteine hydrolase family protein [Pararhodospirillum oryzae]|uniref:Nicotinamidase/pyrazinamidase n=1 Tax=Pararhodospirillum oryzae TaxID=478448 RepID=A0A512H9C6_9PROT|nr:cysteine hydrolase [Pararhodospirillum oryzae]GEO82042.1 nicotinamidase/pyrazinamidase [Pararhodospirillum oryzae]